MAYCASPGVYDDGEIGGLTGMFRSKTDDVIGS
jgi:hypothetical protein